MPKGPKGKRVPSIVGEFAVVSKNANHDGSVYFDQPFVRTDGTSAKGRWRATYRDADGRLRRVSASTRAVAEQRRAEALELVAATHPHAASQFTAATTVGELASWWLQSVARHQVRASSLETYRKVLAHLVDEFGSRRVRDVGAESLTVWQSTLLDRYSAYTVLNSRKVGRQVFAEAVKFGLIAFNPFDLVKAPRARPQTTGRALGIADARQLVTAAADVHLGLAVTLLFCQGWRVSEVLGLAWDDIDFKDGTARVTRAATHLSGRGVILGPTKTDGTQGVHHLAPITIAGLKARRLEQNAERLVCPTEWPEHRYDGQPIRPIFTNSTGGLVNRQTITKVIERAARRAGIDPAGLGTHAGRRTVITALYADGGVDLADVARHVGHTNTSTTAGYVRSLGNRPMATATKAAELLDPTVHNARKPVAR